MNGSLRIGLIAAAVIVVVVATSAVFVVSQTQQALVLRFGAIRSVVTKPGLNFKLPLVDSVILIDKRILDLDLPAQEVLASDQNRLIVDAFARYRVIDPLRFFQSVNSIAGANARLFPIANSAVRNVIADANITAIVRSDRSALMNRIQEDVNRQARGLGLEIIDMRLTRVDLPAQNSQAVYDRMKTEREREAADLRANGSQQAQTIRARADRDVVVLLGDANRKAEETRGQGDAERNRVFAEAYGRDPEFFAFYRSMQAYEQSLKAGDTRLVLTPDSPFFRYFNDPTGQRQPAPVRP